MPYIFSWMFTLKVHLMTDYCTFLKRLFKVEVNYIISNNLVISSMKASPIIRDSMRFFFLLSSSLYGRGHQVYEFSRRMKKFFYSLGSLGCYVMFEMSILDSHP